MLIGVDNKLNYVKVKNFVQEIIRFSLTGGICFLIDYGIMVLLKEVCGVNYLLASIISFTISVFINYFMCIFWVFDSANKSDRKTIMIFISTSVIGLLLTILLMWIMVDILDIYYMISKIISTIIVTIWNYVTKKKAIQI